MTTVWIHEPLAFGIQAITRSVNSLKKMLCLSFDMLIQYKKSHVFHVHIYMHIIYNPK